ncbi:MAG: carbohydrate-binding protein, partial [Oscillospiraceae bacterium]|nr:carbohydrate-binding protein [Oscillospiraceae bacterium]
DSEEEEEEEEEEIEEEIEEETEEIVGFVIGFGTTLIEATQFDSELYNESDPEAGEHAVRPDEEIQTEAGESGFEGNIGWTSPGEWVQYTIYVTDPGTYKFEAYLASGAGEAGNIELLYNDAQIGSTESEDTEGWQAYSWYLAGTAELGAGGGVIKVEFTNGNTNLAALRITSVTAPSSVTAFGLEAPEFGGLIKGAAIGAATGWDDNANTGRAAAFDADPGTFFDPQERDNPEYYAGIRTDIPYYLTEIRILPRDGQLGRFLGASIWGFNGDVFDPETASLIWESDAAAEAFEFQVITIDEFLAVDAYFSSFAYFNAAEHGDVAEVELYGMPLETIPNPVFVDGGPGFGETEGSDQLFNGNTSTKYCANIEQHGEYWASWKYETAYIADAIILATANDNRQYPRRLGDGWTLSGSNDGEEWTVIYTGSADDYENDNYAFFIISLENEEAYEYYKILSETGGDGDTIQLTQVLLMGNEPAPVVEEAEEYEEGEPIIARDAYIFLVSLINNQILPEAAMEYAETVGLITGAYMTRYRHETKVDGVPGTFDLEAPMTRQEFAVVAETALEIIKKFGISFVLKSSEPSEILTFDDPRVGRNDIGVGGFTAPLLKANDIGVGGFTARDAGFADSAQIRLGARSAVENMVKLGILKPRQADDGRLFIAPNDPITLAEITDLLMALSGEGNITLSSFSVAVVRNLMTPPPVPEVAVPVPAPVVEEADEDEDEGEEADEDEEAEADDEEADDDEDEEDDEADDEEADDDDEE